MIKFCFDALQKLSRSNNWAKDFVNLRMEFARLYQKGLTTSTSHDTHFFENVVAGLEGATWEEKGEYGDNFRKLVKLGRETIVTDKDTGLFVQELKNGFLGLPVTYFLWSGNNLIAHSTDKVNWKMGTWFQKISPNKSEQKIDNKKVKSHKNVDPKQLTEYLESGKIKS